MIRKKVKRARRPGKYLEGPGGQEECQKSQKIRKRFRRVRRSGREYEKRPEYFRKRLRRVMRSERESRRTRRSGKRVRWT